MQAVAEWLERARAKLAAGEFCARDLDGLEVLLSRAPMGGEVTQPRQQILYLQTADSSPTSRVVGMRCLLPGEAHGEYALADGEFPYATVMAAVEDGWRVIQFPVPPTDFRDDAIDYLGFEFVLERWCIPVGS
jgi:hypothetical protein